MSHGSCRQVRAGLNTIWDHLVISTMEFTHPLNRDHVGSCTVDSRTSLDEKVGQIYDLRLLGRIFQHGDPFGKRRRHHEVFRTGHRRCITVNACTSQSFRLGCDIAVLDGDVSP